MEHSANDKLSEALKLLEEAAMQKKDELKHVLADKYKHLKTIIIETDGSLARSLADAKKHAIDAAAHARDVSVDKAKEIAHDVDKRVHQNPWPYIAGTAGAALLAGFLIGRSRK